MFIELQMARNEPPGVKPPALVLSEVIIREYLFLSPLMRRWVDPIRVGVDNAPSDVVAIIREIGELLLREIVTNLFPQVMYGFSIDANGICHFRIISISTSTRLEADFPLSYRRSHSATLRWKRASASLDLHDCYSDVLTRAVFLPDSIERERTHLAQARARTLYEEVSEPERRFPRHL